MQSRAEIIEAMTHEQQILDELLKACAEADGIRAWHHNIPAVDIAASPFVSSMQLGVCLRTKRLRAHLETAMYHCKSESKLLHEVAIA